jgi:hypothetical protein
MGGGRRHRDGREEWRGAALNELHGDYLAHERLVERRARAALVAAARPAPAASRLRRLADGVTRAVLRLL